MPLESPTEGHNRILRVFQSKTETRAFYNKISKVYDLLAERTEEPVRRAGIEMLAATEGERVLEIGCGTGHCLAALAKAVGPSGRVYGIDLSEGMLALAKTLLDREGVADRVALQCGDANNLPYRLEAMDGVFMSFTLELFDTPDIPMVLDQCRCVLKPGGRLVVVGMSKEGEQGVVVETFEWTHRHFPNFVDCRPIFVRQAVEAAGFDVKQVAKMHMWVPVEIVLAAKVQRR